jgi:hypothetical protein
MLKIKSSVPSVKVTATERNPTIHESTRGCPSRIGAKTGGDVVLKAVVFKTFMNVSAAP